MKLNNSISLFLTLFFFLTACKNEAQKENTVILPKEGSWRMQMDLGKKSLPFNFHLSQNQDQWKMMILNADEKIEVSQIEFQNDSLIIDLPVFESSFFLKIIDSIHLEGVWINYYKSDNYKIPVAAKFAENFRFIPESSNKSILKLHQKYRVSFVEEDQNTFDAIGIFSQTGNKLNGSFATETGDYRYLEGNVTKDSLFLSTFDGSHAFLFEARAKNDTLYGKFWSGTHYRASWTAFPDSTFELRNPDSLTFLKEGYDSFHFSLTDLNGDKVSLSDEKFKNKVVIVQIMGSWCPNCLDETKYLTQLYDQYHEEGLEIVALAFERTKSEEKALQNLKALKNRTNLNYPLLLGGSTKADSPEKVLPMLNHIMSYPTAIFIDKKGEVRKIHTGFYGPGTGKYYTDFTKETEAFVSQLLSVQLQ